MELSVLTKHQSDRSFPRLSFPNGISSLAKLNGDEMPGVILMLLLSLACEKGRHKFITDLSLFDRTTCNKWIKMLSDLLALDSLMRRKDFLHCQLRNYNVTLIDNLMNLKEVINRESGNEMKLIKFHLFAHLFDDIKRFGSCRNWNSGTRESNFKHYKSMINLTQKRVGDSFPMQLANRFIEYEAIHKASFAASLIQPRDWIINHSHSQSQQLSVSSTRLQHRGTRFEIILNGRDTLAKYSKKKHENKIFRLPKYFYDILLDAFGDKLPSNFEMKCHTECYFDSESNIIRGDSCFGNVANNEVWHD